DAVLAVAAFPADGALLDVGCGTGSLSFAMARRWPGRAVVGVDIADAYVAFARAKAAGGNPNFASADATALPYEAASFAGAAAQLVLNFIPEPLSALREMRRVVRPGGVLAGAVWDFRGGLVYQRLFWDTACGIDAAARAVRDRLFAAPLALPEGLPRLFEAAGLREVRRDSVTIRMDYADFADYWRPLLGGQGPVGSYVVGLAPALRQRVEAAVGDAYCAGAPDGPRSLTATAWVVRGTVP
ncbi:MAG TPA: methyltransferase domain-containing protein, partial [Candidatus Sulfotelmatobacter sp.]|nr:methyltransferase domain-containing protein [Candidatus Sulfotelmatobacter sp.]